MPIEHIHAFVVRPRKGEKDSAPINGTTLKLSGKMFDLLESIYEKASEECNVGITFAPTDGGRQQNDCRDLICSYIEAPSMAHGEKIAARLELHTDGRSGTGLLFVIVGKEGRTHKLVISRFPTDNAIYVEENERKVTVEFLERVFMKNKTSYKAVLYEGPSIRGDFWSGHAVDKQINPLGGELSNYWIADFLLSRMTTTAAAGTKRFAVALRDAAKAADLDVKQELTAAATLAAGLRGRRTSINGFAEQFNLSQGARSAVAAELRTPELADEVFVFDSTEFKNIIAYKSIELDNGGMLTAPSGKFDDVFERENAEDGEVSFKTQGRIINERLRAKS